MQLMGPQGPGQDLGTETDLSAEANGGQQEFVSLQQPERLEYEQEAADPEALDHEQEAADPEEADDDVDSAESRLRALGEMAMQDPGPQDLDLLAVSAKVDRFVEVQLEMLMDHTLSGRAALDAVCKEFRFSTPRTMDLCTRHYRERALDDGVVMAVHNRTFLPNFAQFKAVDQERLKQSVHWNLYGEDIQSVAVMDSLDPAECALTVNQWGNDVTNGAIAEMVDEDMFSPYFYRLDVGVAGISSEFAVPFPRKNTRENEGFYKNSARKERVGNVSMMHLRGDLAIDKQGHWNTVRMPYPNSSLVILLSMNDATNYDDQIVPEPKDLTTGKGGDSTECDLSVPKLQIAGDFAMGTVPGIWSLRENNETLEKVHFVPKVVVQLTDTVVFEEEAEPWNWRRAFTQKMRDLLSFFVTSPGPECLVFDHPFWVRVYDEKRKQVLFSGLYAGEQ